MATRSKDDLLRELDQQRTRLVRRGAEVEAAADVGRHWRRSVARHPLAWVGGGLLGGIAVARLLVLAAAKDRSSGGQKSASHRWKSVLPTMPFAASFLAQAAIQTIRPQLEKILRDQFGRATSRLTNPPASSGAPPRRSSSD